MTPDVTYTLEYDALGAQTQVKVGSQALSTNVYSGDRSHKLLRSEFGNGGKIVNEYDDFDRLKSVRFDADTAPRYEYEYGANGQASYVTDNNLHRVHQTEYDLAERPCQMTTRDAAGNLIYRATLVYDKMNRLTTFRQTASGQKYETLYGYDKDNRPAPEKNSSGTITKHAVQYGALADGRYVDYEYDDLGRIKKRIQGNGTGICETTYAFAAGNPAVGNSTTPLVTSITQPGLTLEYTYDDTGNILSEKRGDQQTATTYAYDKLGQLVRVDDPNESATWVYSYDYGGNILSKKRYALTAPQIAVSGTPITTFSYTYDTIWKDKLISITETPSGGTGIVRTIGYGSYSQGWDIGNPNTYDGWTFDWQAGRQLKSMAHVNAQSVQDKKLEFANDANGLRIQKKVTEGSTVTTTDYTLHGELVMHQKVAKVVNNGTPEIKELHFFYGAQSRPAMVNFNGTLYTYVFNSRSDIVGIVDSVGMKVVEYSYDAWGNVISTAGALKDTLGKANPFRYRGNQYDEETQCYYLRTRYYNPEWGRFINEDISLGTGGLLSHNQFCYCNNNPIKHKDSSGNIPTVIEAAEMSQYVEAKVYEADLTELSGSWVYDSTITGGDNMQMFVFTRKKDDESIEYALVNKGTTTTGDAWSDVKQYFGESLDMTASINKAENFVGEHGQSEVTFVGHSKGGAEAAMNALATNRNAIVFNPMDPMIKGEREKLLSTFTKKIVAYVTHGDPLNGIFGWDDRLGKVNYLNRQYGWWEFGKNHSIGAVIKALKSQ